MKNTHTLTSRNLHTLQELYNYSVLVEEPGSIPYCSIVDKELIDDWIARGLIKEYVYVSPDLKAWVDIQGASYIFHCGGEIWPFTLRGLWVLFINTLVAKEKLKKSRKKVKGNKDKGR